ncbi:MAG: exonuclease [Thermodesulfobacteriota bacterium]
MGILSNTVSFCQYQVSGEFPDKDLYEWAADRLAQNAFRAIDQTAEELSFGWVHFDDFSNNSFTTPHAFWRDHYLAFTLRRDQRRVPAVLLKAYQEKAENDYLASNPGLKWVPKDKRHDLRNAVRSALLSKTLPLPAMYDAVWDTRTGVVTFNSLTPKIQELFEHLFERTFQMGLVAIHPFARAERVLDKSLRPALQKANCAPTDAVADLIKGNRWLGLDFLLWLIYQTTNSSLEYTVSRPGTAPQGAPFVAYLNDRFVLLGGGDKGAQKITVAGRQDNFKEALTALQNGKEITEATLYLEKEEHVWRMTLKGETFYFASFKCPAVKLERDELTDESSEREAVFYERMHVLEGGLQLFDSLYNEFLNKRLNQEWEQITRAIREWLSSGAT